MFRVFLGLRLAWNVEKKMLQQKVDDNYVIRITQFK